MCYVFGTVNVHWVNCLINSSLQCSTKRDLPLSLEHVADGREKFLGFFFYPFLLTEWRHSKTCSNILIVWTPIFIWVQNFQIAFIFSIQQLTMVSFYQTLIDCKVMQLVFNLFQPYMGIARSYLINHELFNKNIVTGGVGIVTQSIWFCCLTHSYYFIMYLINPHHALCPISWHTNTDVYIYNIISKVLGFMDGTLPIYNVWNCVAYNVINTSWMKLSN